MNIYRPFTLVLLLAGIFFFLQSASTQNVSTKDAPAAVLSAFKKAYPKATVIAVSKESAEEKDYYKIQSVDGKTKRNVYYTPKGEAVETEESIEPAKLPAAIQKYLKKKYLDGYIVAGVFVKSKDISGYQIDIQNGKKKLSLSFDATGKLLK